VNIFPSQPGGLFRPISSVHKGACMLQ
jgi:hypothetical protein